jgi:alkanesulfonate monooxygenase SsuD/methylene tetrahydromethanopterin reductase-like flavin-dependent oxidoreductase (luciferase family)
MKVEPVVRFGIQFFPDQREDQKSPVQYYDEAMHLVGLCDEYGYSHVRTVEHYFHHWGGYSSNPMIFLTAACQHTKTARMVTGAVLPAFNSPLKLASDLCMLDAFSNGRLDVGFARAFLPQEFRHFEVDMDESVERFEEGIKQVQLLMEGENVTSKGKFHSFENVTTMPRPTQLPRPNFYVAAVGTPASFERAGKMGHWIMAIPGVGSDPIALLETYRDAWTKANHPSKPKMMMAVFMFCHEDGDEARRIAKPHIEGHFAQIVDAMKEYTDGSSSNAYKNYDVLRAKIATQTLESQIESGAAFVGNPSEIIKQLEVFNKACGGCDELSLQVNPFGLKLNAAEASMRLFGTKVMPYFQHN